MRKFRLLAKLFGAIDELVALLNALHGARVFLDDLIARLQYGIDNGEPVNIAVSGARLVQVATLLRRVVAFLDRFPIR